MNRRLTAVLGGAWALLLSTYAQAITLGFEPASQTVGNGATVDVAVVISGLGNMSAPSLGAFDLSISFDPSLLAYDHASFGDPVLGDQLDIFGLGGNPTFDGLTAPGTVDIFELSLDTTADLNGFQADAFTLATLTFDAIGAGTSALGISINPDGLVDAEFPPNALTATLTDGSVTVTGTTPEPATLALLGLGIVGMQYQRRRPIRA